MEVIVVIRVAMMVKRGNISVAMIVDRGVI